jgi:hypothetical protein
MPRIRHLSSISLPVQCLRKKWVIITNIPSRKNPFFSRISRVIPNHAAQNVQKKDELVQKRAELVPKKAEFVPPAA